MTATMHAHVEDPTDGLTTRRINVQVAAEPVVPCIGVVELA